MTRSTFCRRFYRRFHCGWLAVFLAAILITTGDAGDILRGGAPAAAPMGNAAGGSNTPVSGMSSTAGRDALARTTQALQAVQAMQAAAHAAALKGANNLGIDPNHPGIPLPNVPNGLAVGGLQVAPGVPKNLSKPQAGDNPALWQGATLPRQTVSAGTTNVTIKQTQQQALLNWETFNVGKQTTVDFDQSAGGADTSEWIAFNTITDPTGRPSQILGSIEAPGQVYLLNQNGIIFGGSSQVNLHTLVASSLPINDNLLTRGLLNNPDDQFLFSALPIPELPSGGTLPAFNPPPAPNTPSGLVGDVTVQPGATLSSPTTPDHVGGRIALIGLNVTNGGTISTPDGQTILAAGQQVAFTAHPSTDPSLRGLDTYVGVIGPYGSVATNTGLIDAPRADVTLTGGGVEQDGVIASSTSVSLNGRIDLLANYNTVPVVVPGQAVALSPSASGIVTLGQDSVTDILPELDSSETIVGATLALPSQVNLQGLGIHLSEGADLVAPDANISLSAGTWQPLSSGFGFFFTEGQIYLDAGAAIDAAGSADVPASVSENIIPVQLRAAELANSPLQRNGPLRGQTIDIDIRDTGTYNGVPFVGTPLADTSGYVALIKRTVGELTTAGGSVKLTAGDSLVMQPGASVNVSGGSISYTGAVVQTTKVITTDGQIIDISQATPDRIYQGIYTGGTESHPKWGITQTTTNPLVNAGIYDPGYIQGGNGGALAITAPSMALDGTFLGATVVGPRQRTTPPALSSLSLTFAGQQFIVPFYQAVSPTPPTIVFQNSGRLPAAAPFALDDSGVPQPLDVTRRNNVILSPELLTLDGFGSLTVDNSDGQITIPRGVSLNAPTGGAISLAAANLDVGGQISAPGGDLSFSVFDFSPYDLITLLDTTGSVTPPFDPTRGHFVLGAHAVLDAKGLIADDRNGFAADTFPLVTNGGAITIKSYSVDLEKGSHIDVSGGADANANGSVTYGAGGAISIQAGHDPNIPSLLGGKLNLGGSFSGYGGGNEAGSFSIVAPAVQIGGGSAPADTLLLKPSFFSQGGFGSYNISGIGFPTDDPDVFIPGLTVVPGTMIAPVAQSEMVPFDFTAGSPIVLEPVTLPTALRSPVSLSFSAVRVNDFFDNLLVVRGDLVFGKGAEIRTDPNAAVSLSGGTVAVLGSIIAPGGKIAVSGGNDSTVLFTDEGEALPTVDLGPDSFLSTAGTTLLTPNLLGFKTGLVLPGGSITVSGNIVAEKGSILDVSGTSDTLDVPPGSVGLPLPDQPTKTPLVPARIDSNAGSITLSGARELFTDATLIGNAGGPSAVGGTLAISSGRFISPTVVEPQTPLDVTLDVTQSGPVIPAPFYPAGETAIGNPVLDSDGQALPGLGYFAANSFIRSGFDSLTLGGTVEFSGAVTLSARGQLTLGTAGVIYADAPVHLTAAAVTLGLPFIPPTPPQLQVAPFQVANQPFYFLPTYGPGKLNISAQLIDVGNLSLQNIGAANLVAANGDIRGDGTFDIAGDISLTAGQIYPPTEVTFNIAAFDYEANDLPESGSITVRASGNRQLPLSAGGVLNLFATNITQGGVLRAPIGTINVGHSDFSNAVIDPISNQPFASTDRLTLSPTSIISVSAVDPANNTTLIIPYGTNPDGTAFIDPSGIDITSGGVPEKTVSVSAVTVIDQSGAIIDLRGGGDLFAYQFVPGLGGTNDILASPSSFAVIPGYKAKYAPIDPDYANSALAVGDQVQLGPSDALPAGTYTLLPARYALLPGAVLVTPVSGIPSGSSLQADGSSLVSGYRFNAFDKMPTGQALLSEFEVAPSAVVGARAQYIDFFANTYLKSGAADKGNAVPRLPIDSGRLVLAATGAMSIQGSVLAQAPDGGKGGLVDIDTPSDILIGGPGVVAPINTLLLESSELSSFAAESLLIGGLREDTASGTVLQVTTDNITVNNAGTPLTGSDLILAANDSLTLADGAVVIGSSSEPTSSDPLTIGDATVPGSGNGTLLRVSSDPLASIARLGVDTSASPSMIIGAGVKLLGGGLVIDSTFGTDLNPTARLSATAVALDSGQISLRLTNPGDLQPTSGLVLSGEALASLQSHTRDLSLLSYSSLDIYGTGQIGSASAASLAVHAAEIRGFNIGDGSVTFAAKQISLDNSAGGEAPGGIEATEGAIIFDADTVTLGANQLAIDQFTNVALNAKGGILTQLGGALVGQGDMDLVTPLITGATASNYTISTAGSLTIERPTLSETTSLASGLGAQLTLIGESLNENSDIILPSGTLQLRATGAFAGDRDVSVGGMLNVAGIAQSFYDLAKYTDGGEIELNADNGNVKLLPGSLLTVAAPVGGGSAGTLSVAARQGDFSSGGALLGNGGAGGDFSLDIKALPNTASLSQILNDGGFTQSRMVRVRTGNVILAGNASSQLFNLSADQGSITVVGKIDASSSYGGQIELYADSDLTLVSGSQLIASGIEFDGSGKGGLVDLETRGADGGEINLLPGSAIDLSIGIAPGGTLHLRAPQNAAASDLAIGQLKSQVYNAASVIAEGYRVFDASADGSIDEQEPAVLMYSGLFANNGSAIASRLLGPDNSLAPVFHVRPGAEIVSTGDLVLHNDWDLSTYRFGPRKPVVDETGHPILDSSGNPVIAGVEPGILSLRAAGSITFSGALTDGFGDSAGDVPTDTFGDPARWKSPLLPVFADGTSQESWSYRITAGADVNAADFRSLAPQVFGVEPGSLLLGVNAGAAVAQGGANAISDTVLAGHYQVIRTGTGDIDISTAGDVRLLNQFATIYTAGTQVADPTLGGTFDLPILNAFGGGDLGAIQENPPYPAQYSFGGGHVTIAAGGDIVHLTQDINGNVLPDSERQLPVNWLYRRGFVDPTTGQFGTSKFGDVESTTWWVDFSNFFEGVGALGGGDVTMVAGGNITNVDAVVPTNARQPKNSLDPAQLVELGGGNLIVRAGNDIDGGVYYVEKGNGTLTAGNTIHTNSTRSPSLTNITSEAPLPPETWLPTTLFLGKGGFTVTARGDVTLGPVANPFLLPEGYSNTYWYKTYFSTYALTDFVDVSSLSGTVALREDAAPLTAGAVAAAVPLLQSWLQNVLLLPLAYQTAAYYQPWLRLDETDVSQFGTLVSIEPSTFSATAFSGSLDLVGRLILSPAPTGNVDLAAADSINGVQISGETTLNQIPVNIYSAGYINLSDADPGLIPGALSPFAYQEIVGTTPAASSTGSGFLQFIDQLFAESGSTEGTQGVLQTKQELHAPGILHADDPNPIHLYAQAGDISGLTLFSGKAARVDAGEDLTDVGLYIQNVRQSDISVIAAGRDIIAYDANSPLRAAALSPGKALAPGADPATGDLQITGPGALEVLAGRNLDLGIGSTNSDGTGVGITSIGNARNPSLPFAGAEIIAAAGIGPAAGLASSKLDFTDFDALFLNPATAADGGARYLPDLGAELGLTNVSNAEVWAVYQQLPPEEQDRFSLGIFYDVLRDSARDRTKPGSPTFGTYESGFAAISALLPKGVAQLGNIILPTREIETASGGDIDLFAPGGGLTVGLESGTPAADQGILTEDGGNISIFTNENVAVGTSRIFTLRGGNEIIWSTTGNIAAGASSKTVQSAPPTRVLIDPQSGDVKTDLAGLATGGGIGVLDTVTGVPPGDVDLIAPAGTVDAGDAGIRVSGNLNISAVQVLNAGNISVAGVSAGVPTVAAPNLTSLSAATNAVGASTNAAVSAAQQAVAQPTPAPLPSIVTVEVIGYGDDSTSYDNGSGSGDDKRRKKKRG